MDTDNTKQLTLDQYKFWKRKLDWNFWSEELQSEPDVIAADNIMANIAARTAFSAPNHKFVEGIFDDEAEKFSSKETASKAKELALTEFNKTQLLIRSPSETLIQRQ